MDIVFIKSKLKAGDVFKNRKALCEHLGETYTSQTHSKMAQDREWRKYFDFEIIEGTQKIRITKIYDKAKMDFSVKGGSMPKILDPAILLYLAKSSNKYFTIPQLAINLMFCSTDVINFYTPTVFKKLEDKYVSPEKGDAKDKKLNIMANFISYTQSLYDSRLKNAIERLSRNKSIRIKPVLLIINNKGFNDEITSLIEQKKYNELKKLVAPQVYDLIEKEIIDTDISKDEYLVYCRLNSLGITNDDVREALDGEVEFINDITSKVLEEYECTTEKEFYEKTGWKPRIRIEYHSKRNKLLRKHHLANFKAYKLEWIDKEGVSTIEEDINDLQIKINRSFYTAIKRNKLKEYRESRDNSIKKAKYPDMMSVKYVREEIRHQELLDEFLRDFVKA